MPTRPTLSTGLTVFTDNTVLTAADLEAEFTVLFAAFASLGDAEIAVAADINPSKIGDYSSGVGVQRTSTDPGTGNSPALATDLVGEIEGLRYAIERLSLGISGTNHAFRYDGSSNVALGWIEFPARAGNLVTNGCFLHKTTSSTAAPEGWTLVGTPTTCDTVTSGLTAEGSGRAIRLVADAATEGISTTLKSLKGAQRYLICCRAKATSGTARMVVSGADSASQYRGITLTTTSSTFSTLKCVVQTDSTPTDIVVQLDGLASGADVQFTHVAAFPCYSDVQSAPDVPMSYASEGSGGTILTGAYATRHTLAVYIPTSGYQIHVTANLCGPIAQASVDQMSMNICENGTQKIESFDTGPGLNYNLNCVAQWVNLNPTPGLYTYTLQAHSTNFAMLVTSGSLCVDVRKPG